jgi:thiamine pyrophosphokinase
VTAVVLAAGRAVATAELRRRVAGAALVVAADGGARHARVLGVRPDVIVGDFDSVDDATLRRFPEAELQHYERDKDALDLELALDLAVERGARSVLIVGALGDRLDQGLAAVRIAEARQAGGLEVELHSGDALALPVRAGQARSVELPEGTVFSVLASVRGTRASVRGARFGIEDGVLDPGTGLGVSNEAAGGTVTLELHAGAALLVVPRLPAVDPADVIWGAYAERVEANLRAVDPVLGDLVKRVAYDEVFAGAALDLRTQELLALAHLVGLGHEDDVRTHLHGALRAGATPQELRALLAHAAMFVGFPRALMAARVLRQVLEPRS